MNTPCIVALSTERQARACAEIMSSSEPWMALGRDFATSLEIVTDPKREAYVVLARDEVVGFVVLVMEGAFVGYVQSVAVRADRRGKGLGARLIRFAEDRIFRDTPNVFLCVSSFNKRAKTLYERLGYRLVGELPDYLVTGHSELLMRKSLGPLLTPR